MPNLRGTAFLNIARYVRERFGAGAHERVIAALPAAAAAPFLAELRESAWKPAEHLVAYMEKARALLAPDEAGFFRDVGRFSGRHVRDTAFRTLLTDPDAAARQSAFLWGAFYDAGRLEMRREGDMLLIRILDFPSPGRSLCERQAGFIQGALEAWGGAGVRVEKVACVFDGAPHCEIHALWTSMP